MYTISGNDRHLAVAMLRSRVPLSAEQKDALAKELKDDPERRGSLGLARRYRLEGCRLQWSKDDD